MKKERRMGARSFVYYVGHARGEAIAVTRLRQRFYGHRISFSCSVSALSLACRSM